MEVLQAIRTRRSYRGLYLDTPVPREHLRAIMEAGCAAPKKAPYENRMGFNRCPGI